MNCFLVRLRHSCDDLPLFITDDRETAMRVARGAPWIPGPKTLDLLVAPDISTPIRIDVIEYRDGLPVEVVKVRDYDEELALQESPQ